MPLSRPALALLGLLALPAGAQAGAIVVNHDSATLNTPSPGVARFSQNLVRFLDSNPAPGGRVLVFNRAESLGNQANLADTFFGAAVSAIGYDITVADAAAPFSLATLAPFDVVLLAGPLRDALGNDIKDDAVLDAYVARGGGVYIAGGAAGFGTEAGEARYWNSFLDDYGLAFAPVNNNRFGLLGGGTGPLFDGVGLLNAGNGRDILLTGTNPNAAIVQFAPGSGTLGLTASFVAPQLAMVPGPGGLPVLLGALGLLALLGGGVPPRR
jgi:hypothetical protein